MNGATSIGELVKCRIKGDKGHDGLSLSLCLLKNCIRGKKGLRADGRIELRLLSWHNRAVECCSTMLASRGWIIYPRIFNEKRNGKQ